MNIHPLQSRQDAPKLPADTAKAQAAESQGSVIATEYKGNRRIEYEVTDGVVSSHSRSISDESKAKGLKDKIRSFLFPSSFPGSVTPDYMQTRKYSAVQSMCSSAMNFFNTQFVLNALNIAFPAAGVAAIAWMSKDSLMGVGKFAGSYLAKKVDQDPQRWHLLGKLVHTAGFISEATLAVVPGAFIPMAVISQAIKAGGETLVGAAGVNIEKHQAVADNIGEIKSKNMNQEMVANGIGTGLAMALQVGLAATGIGGVGLAAAYALFAAGSIIFAHKTSKALDMNALTANKLAKLSAGFLEKGAMMTPAELKGSTSLLETVTGSYGHKLELGASLEPLSKKPASFVKLATLFNSRNYLVYREGDSTMISLRPKATDKDVAESLLCTALLERQLRSPEFTAQKEKLGEEGAVLDAIERSVAALPKDGRHLEALTSAGWSIDRLDVLSNRRADWNA